MKSLVLVLGASENPERYSYKAADLLLQKNYAVALVGQKNGRVFNLDIKTIEDVMLQNQQPDVVTLYVGPKNQSSYYDQILRWKPKHVIFNPGTENPELQALLTKNNIAYVEACTLVLLNNGLFAEYL